MKSAFQLLALAVLATGAEAQEFRETSVPNAQISAVVRDVAEWHNMQYANCQFAKPLGSETVEKVEGSTVEHWSIEACDGKAFTYKVRVIPHAGGGVTDSVSNVDGSAVGENGAMSDEELTIECKAMREEKHALGVPDKLDHAKVKRYYHLIANLAICNANESAP